MERKAPECQSVQSENRGSDRKVQQYSTNEISESLDELLKEEMLETTNIPESKEICEQAGVENLLHSLEGTASNSVRKQGENCFGPDTLEQNTDKENLHSLGTILPVQSAEEAKICASHGTAQVRCPQTRTAYDSRERNP